MCVWSRGGVSNFRNTVNIRPVRILLECILVRLAHNFQHYSVNENNYCLMKIIIQSLIMCIAIAYIYNISFATLVHPRISIQDEVHTV